MEGKSVSMAVLRVRLALMTDKFKHQIAGLRGYITKLKKQVQSGTNEIDKLNKKLKGTSEASGEAQANMGKWLGVGLSMMFISQGIASAMGRLMSPVLELTGLFDVWRATLISVLAPVLVPFSMMLMKIMFWFMKLPKGAKQFLGWTVLIIAGVASVIAAMAPWFLLLKALNAPGALGFVSTFCGGFKRLALCTRTGLTLVGKWFFALAGVIGFVIAVWKLFTETDRAKKWARGITIALAVVAGVVAFLLGAPIAIAIAIGGALAFISSMVITHWEAIAEWFKNWGKVITRYLLLPFQPFIMVLKYIMKMLDKISGTKLGGTSFGKALDFAAFQEGGIVTRPTLGLIGEAGPEAVIPLSGGAGSGINININVQGTFGNSSDARNTASAIQSALRDELRRLGVR